MSAAAKFPSQSHAFPVAVICLIILAVWYLACISMNWVVTEAKIEAAGGGLHNILAMSWNHERPVIPAPHQIVAIWYVGAVLVVDMRPARRHDGRPNVRRPGNQQVHRAGVRLRRRRPRPEVLESRERQARLGIGESL